MTEYIIGNATVRIHGTPDRQRLEAATAKFLKAAERQRRKNEKAEESHCSPKKADAAVEAESSGLVRGA